jgi:hypothetical protein
MNKKNCGTENEQSVGCQQMTEWSSADCRLWNSLIIKKGMMVRNPFKEQNGKNRYKNLKKKFCSRETF